MNKKGEPISDNLPPWIIMVGAILLIFTLYFILSGKGNSALDWFKQIWRFGK